MNTNDNRFVPNFNPYDKVRDALKFDLKTFNPTGPPSTDILLLVPVNQPDVSKIYQGGFLTTWIDKYSWEASDAMSPPTWDGWGVFGSRGIKGDIADYGERLDLKDVEAFVDACGTRDYGKYALAQIR